MVLMRSNKSNLLAVSSLVLACASFAGSAHAGATSGTLYYTTFGVSQGNTVFSLDYNYNGLNSFSVSNNTPLALTNGADGIVIAPNGNLIVSGQSNNNLTELTTGGAIVNTVNPGGQSYHLALSSSAPNATLYNTGNGGCGSNCISAVTLSGGGLVSNGVAYNVVNPDGFSTDVRALAFNPINHTWYYDTGADDGQGDFGTVTFSGTTATLKRLNFNLWAHGMVFDSFTGDMIVNSGNVVEQVDANGNVLSTYTGPGGDTEYDQPAIDGLGHLFVASNDGNMTFIDYAASGLIGANIYNTSVFVNAFLDDITPTVLTNTTDVPEPASALVMGAGLLALRRLRKSRAA